MTQYNPEGELGLPVFTPEGWDQLSYVYDCLYYHDEYGPGDISVRRLARHMDMIDGGQQTGVFRLVGKRAMEVYRIILDDEQHNTPISELAEAVDGKLPDYPHSVHTPVAVTAA